MAAPQRLTVAGTNDERAAGHNPPADPVPPTRPSDGRVVPAFPASRSAGQADPVRGRRPRFISLRVVVPAVAAILIAGALATAALISERNARTMLVREIETRLVLEARNLALTSATALLDDFPELTLQPVVSDLVAARRELEFVAVVDHEGIIRGHPDTRMLGRNFTLPRNLSPTPATVKLAPGEQLLANDRTLVAVAPVTHASGQHLGQAVVGMRRDYLDSAIAEARRQLIVVLAVLLVVGGAVTLVLISQMLRPISDLRRGLERIGQGDLDTPLEIRDRTELGLLAETVNRMTGQLKVAQREALDRERLASELELARTIQQSLLPTGRLQQGDFVMSGAHRAAAEVGGDYYDLIRRPDGTVGLAIADVSGKGLSGCLVMSMLSALLHSLHATHESPSAVIVALEENLGQRLQRGSFITMFYGVLDPACGRLTYASAGHLPAIVYRARTSAVEWHRSRAVPIGAIRRRVLQQTLRDESLTLEPGDMLVQFTDGYSEAPAPETGAQFGFDRVEKAVRSNAAGGPDAVIRGLNEAVRSWTGGATPMDDETILVVTRSCVGAASPEVEAAVDPEAELDAPAALIGRAQRDGHHLSLGTRMAELAGLRGWLHARPDLRALPEEVSRRLESALYELCANIIEHGYGNDRGERFDLWWLPAAGRCDDGRRVARDDPSAAHQRATRIRDGLFVIREYGRTFDPSQHERLDFGDPDVRRRGRGLGLEMVYRTMACVDYRGATSEGNLTIMRFDPERAIEADNEV